MLAPVLSQRAYHPAKIGSRAELPSQFGEFRIFSFASADGKEHVALVKGDVAGAYDVVTRIHSECLTGDVLGSLRCDCRQQLELALSTIGQLPRGILLYLRQEGRGIGLTNKIAAYALQEKGLDTVDANLALGFGEDERDYRVAAEMLRALEVRSIHLMTNNPDKIGQLIKHNVAVSARLPHAVAASPHNRRYLTTKAARSGHLIDTGLLEGDGPRRA
ncbi:MAG: GTP cyclohydrolase II [Deltaproteobacteria bacterium]|nr:GTP cyclohydrolase II [Deltaproteobacteria bacterium]